MGTNYYLKNKEETHLCKISGTKPYGTVIWAIDPLSVHMKDNKLYVVDEYDREECPLRYFIRYTGGFKWDLSQIGGSFV